MTRQVARWWIGGALAAAWLISLIVPAAGWGRPPVHIEPGWVILKTGWMGFLNLQFGWCANVGFVLSLPIAIMVQTPQKRLFYIASAAILLPSLDAMAWSNVQTESGNFPVVFGLGYFIWLWAMFGQFTWLVMRAGEKLEEGLAASG